MLSHLNANDIVKLSEHFRKQTNALYISLLAADSHRVKVSNLEILSYQDKGILVIESFVMAELKIRRYREEDHEEVKEVFTIGMSEHIPPSCMHVLKQPLAQMFLGCVFCALLTSSKSILLPVLAVTLLLAAGRQSVSYMFTKYIQTCLDQDLNHIQQTYLDPPNACFWVAESQGRVVGTVACLPAEKDQNFLELKRMSVKKTHRGQGIAKALCRTVADFARERGYIGVMLHTSVVQTDAQKLYEHMGYEKVSEFSAPEVIAKLTNFTLMEYQLIIKHHHN